MKPFIDVLLTLGNMFWLTKVTPDYEKDANGRRTGDNIVGYQYETVLPEREYDKIKVKISGKQLIQSPVSGAVEVAFDGLEATPYVRDGWIQLSFKAKGIKLVQKQS